MKKKTATATVTGYTSQDRKIDLHLDVMKYIYT